MDETYKPFNGVSIKELISRKHGFAALLYTWWRFLKGVSTEAGR